MKTASIFVEYSRMFPNSGGSYSRSVVGNHWQGFASAVASKLHVARSRRFA